MNAFMLPERIDAQRIYLERLRYEFAEEIFYTYASKPEATRFIAWPTHQSVEDTRSYLNYAIPAWNRGTDFAYAIRQKDSNRLVGSIGFVNESGKIQLGYILGPTFWNQGFATEACRAALSHVRHPTIYRIWTFADVDNAASIKVLTKSGLVEEGRLTRWHRFVNQGNAPKDCVLFKVPDSQIG